MEKKTKKRFVWITIICLILLLFLFIALPYWLLPRIVDSIARSAMLDAGLTQPQITTQHVTLFSTQINNLSFESNGIKINCPEIEAKYSPISLIKKEIKSIFVAESCAEFTDILPVELKEKLISTQATLKLSIENKDNYYTGSLNGELLGGNYTSSLSFDIKNGTLIFDGSINPKLKDDFPTPTFVLNYKVTDCYTEAPKGSGELIIPDTNLKLGTSLSFTNNVVDISATLNSVVSKNDPYLERLFSKLDKQNLINSLYTEIYSKLSVKLSTSTKLPAWDLVVRLNDFDTSIAMEKNMQLVLNKGFVSIHLSGLGERWVLHSIPIYIKEVCIDQLKLSNGKFKILADEDQLLLSEGSINAFGGTLSVYALYLNFNHLNAGFTIFVDDIKLNELITALPNLEGTGSGSLHGKLPVTIYQGKKLKLHNAYLFSKPGITGKLKLTDTKLLQEALLTSGIPEQTCSDLGIALSDLDYSVIRLELIDGGYSEQSLQLQIEGSSHQQKSTIPVELNVNIHGGIEKLLNIGLRSQGILNDRKYGENMNLKVVKHYTIYLSIGLIIALAFLKVRALFFLPELELPVIVYEQIVEIPNSSNEISRNIFHSQISDLSINGYQTITPRDLRAYKAWGKTLPKNPIIIAIESIDKSTINYAASILTNYNFSATICIPEEQLKEINNKSVPELATKEELVAFREADVYSYGLKLSSSQYKLASEIKSEINLMKEKLNFAPEALTFPNENNAEAQKALCSTAGVKIGFSPKADTINKLNTKTDFRLLKQQKAIGNRLTFSINAIRHPGALSAGEIFISQPVGQRFKACVSVFDKNFELLLGQQYDALPEEPVLLGKLPNKVEYPISVYITDATGILVYRHEQFNRYTIERGEPVPLEEEIPEALKKALDEIEIPVETGEL